MLLLANARVADAEALLQSRRWAAAYYLLGYAVECGLKACAARQFQQDEVPDKTVVKEQNVGPMPIVDRAMAASRLARLIEQISELADCGVEHMVLEFLSEDGRELDEQMVAFAERVRPKLA